MNNFNYKAAYERFVKAADAYHLTIKFPFLKPQFPEENREDTRLYDLLLDHFDRSIEWFELLSDRAYRPEWHAIHVDPSRSPLDVEDWTIAAPSKAMALGYVIEAMVRERAKPIAVVRDMDKIIIIGSEGELASIEPIRFTAVSPENTKRCETAVKGIGLQEEGFPLLKRLEKLKGYERADAVPTPPNDKYLHDVLHNTPNNLCTILLYLLGKCVYEKVPRNVAQELLASFLGLESWQHLKSLARDRAEWVEPPCMLYRSNKDESTYLDIQYSKGIPKGLYLFGQRLASESQKKLKIGSGFRCWSIGNLTYKPFDRTSQSDWPYLEDTGVVLSEMSRVYAEDEFVYIAATMLDSESFEANLRDYFYSDLDAKERLIRFNEREGVSRGDHFFVGDWVFYLNRTYSEGLFCAERTDGRKTHEQISSRAHKAALVEIEGQFWLATDWDRKPKFLLDGLDAAGADLLEARFFADRNLRRRRRA